MKRIEAKRFGVIIEGKFTDQLIICIFEPKGILDMTYFITEKKTYFTVSLERTRNFTSDFAFRPFKLLEIRPFRTDVEMKEWYIRKYEMEADNMSHQLESLV